MADEDFHAVEGRPSPPPSPTLSALFRQSEALQKSSEIEDEESKGEKSLTAFERLAAERARLLALDEEKKTAAAAAAASASDLGPSFLTDDNAIVREGDFVLVHGEHFYSPEDDLGDVDEDGRPWVAHVLEIDNDSETCKVRYFFRREDVKMPHGGEPPRREDWRRHDAREVFYAFHEDTVEFVSVLYPCTVHFVPYKRRADWDLAARNAASTPGLLCSRVHKPASDDSDAVVHCISDVKIYSTYNQKDRDVVNCAIQQTFEALNVKLEGVAVKTKKGAQPHTSLWLSAGDRVVHDPRKETKMTVAGAGAGAQAAAGKKRTHSTGKLDKLRTKKAKNSSDAAVKVVTPVQGVSAAAGAAPDIEEGDGDVPFPLSSPVEIPKDDDRLLQLLRAVSLRLKLLVSPKDWTVEDKRQIKELPDGDAIMNLEASPVLQILWWVPLTSNDRFNMIGEVQLGKIISELKKKHGKNEVGMKAAAVKNKWKTQLNRFAKEQEEKAEKEEEKEEKEEEKEEEQEQEEQEEQEEEEQEQEEQEEEEDGDDDDDGNEVNEGKVVSSSEEDGMADGEEEEEEKKTVPQVVVIDNGSTDEESDKEEEEEDSEEEENAVPQVVIIDDGSTDDEGAI